jgi:hypothetical protein
MLTLYVLQRFIFFYYEGNGKIYSEILFSQKHSIYIAPFFLSKNNILILEYFIYVGSKLRVFFKVIIIISKNIDKSLITATIDKMI